MSCNNDIRLYDNGTVFIVQFVECSIVDGVPVYTPVDISSASVRTIIFMKPDGTVVKKSAVFTTDGSDGKIQYTSTGDPDNGTGDLDVVGRWEIQGRAELAGGTWTSTKGSFVVESVLDQ